MFSAILKFLASLGLFFGAVVVLTMFAAESFDPRLIWDQMMTDADEGVGDADGE